MTVKPVRKAVIPAAGFGTRFLPQTKAMPKQMMPIVDKPVIQYVVEGLVEAGIKDIIIVTGYHQRAIEDHFDKPHQDLIENLKAGGDKKKSLLDEVTKLGNLANFIYVRQKGPYGNGAPLLNVAHLIGDEPFIYAWSDDFIWANPSEPKQLISAYEKYGASCLSTLRFNKDKDYNSYGFIRGKEVEDGIYEVSEIIEKPGREKAPSDLGIISSFLFTPDIFTYITKASEQMKEGSELYYNDGLILMLKEKMKIMGVEIKGGKFYDLGNKLEYLKAVVEFGLKDKSLSSEFESWLNDRCKE